MTRRALLAGAGLAAVALTAGTGALTPASAAVRPATPVPSVPPVPSATSLGRAAAFLATSSDRFGAGTTLRLPPSYTGGQLSTAQGAASYAYDDALVVLAWLAGGGRDDLARARVLGDTLLRLQADDPVGDGRTRAAYRADVLPADGLLITSPAANTGNQAWLGLALARLFARTREARYLDGALRLARWVQACTADTRRKPFGYTGGRTGDDVALAYKATEHNVDVGAFFAMLAGLTGDGTWRARSRTAFAFVAAMQDDATGHLWTGTLADGRTTNRVPVPEDVQSWSYLATLDRRYARALTWAARELATTDGTASGVASSTADRSAVWFEGNAHLALALRARGAPGDDVRWRTLLAAVQRAQQDAAAGDGRGVVAASRDGAPTGSGGSHRAALHTGTTAWYLLAARGVNPFVL